MISHLKEKKKIKVGLFSSYFQLNANPIFPFLLCFSLKANSYNSLISHDFYLKCRMKDIHGIEPNYIIIKCCMVWKPKKINLRAHPMDSGPIKMRLVCCNEHVFSTLSPPQNETHFFGQILVLTLFCSFFSLMLFFYFPNWKLDGEKREIWDLFPHNFFEKEKTFTSLSHHIPYLIYFIK